MRPGNLLLASLALLLVGTAFLPTSRLAYEAAPPEVWGDGSLLFIENVGQFDPRVRFQVRGGGTTLWLTDDALWVTFALPSDRSLSTVKGAALRLSFPGANPAPRLEPFARQEAVVNYYHGDDPAGWQTRVPVWGGVRYRDLYPGVDLEVGGAAGRLAWRFTGRAPASLSAARLRVAGAEDVAVADGRLRLSTGAGDFALPLPLVDGGSAPAEKPAITRLGDEEFLIAAPFASDRTPAAAAPDITYPEEAYFGSFLGGSGIDWGYDIAVAGQGDILNRDGDFPAGESRSVWLVGVTYSADFPTAPGSGDLHGTTDAFVARFKRTAVYVQPVFSAYVGGSSSEAALGVTTDADGNGYVVGWTTSDDFAVTANAYDTTYNGCADAFLLEMDGDGTLLYATYLGGSRRHIPGLGDECGDDEADAVAVRDGVVYLTGCTSADDFPTTSGAYDRVYSNPDIGLNDDVFVALLLPQENGSAALRYSTFIGGGGWECGSDLAVDDAGTVYVVGTTGSILGTTGSISAPSIDNDFPTTPGAFDTQAALNDPQAFLLHLDPAGNGKADLLYSTFLGGANVAGGTNIEEGQSIALAGDGEVYVAGETGSPDFPTTAGAFDSTCGTDGNCNSRTDFFLSRLNPAGNGEADLRYSTFIGGNYFEGFQGDSDIALGPAGDVYIGGDSSSTEGLPITDDAFDSDGDSGGGDIFVVRLRPQGGNGDLVPVYGTFVGGYSSEAGEALALDEDGRVYGAGFTRSSSFPVTEHALYHNFSGSHDAFFFRLLAPPTLDLSSSTKTVAPQTAAIGQEVTFTVRLVNSGSVGAAVSFTDTLPAMLVLQGTPVASSGPSPEVNGATITWGGTVEADGAVLITYTTQFSAGTAYLPAVNRALVSDGQGHVYTLMAFVNGYRVYLPLVTRGN